MTTTALHESAGGKLTREIFLIILHKSYVVMLGFKLAIPGSAVRGSTEWAKEPDGGSVKKTLRWQVCIV